MKSIELTAYTVREYDIKYTVVLDENDPWIQGVLADNGLTFDQLNTLDYSDYRDLWDTIMSTDYDVSLDEDMGWAEERYVDFEAFISENK